MIVIGDSVSEGYEPVVAANLSGKIYVQHSPWSVGGGADDVNNGLNCEEEFLRTAMYEPGKGGCGMLMRHARPRAAPRALQPSGSL